MSGNQTTSTTLPEAIRNDRKLYQGDLIHYARVLFHHAQNLNHPYHNFRHMFHVLWLTYEACQFYDGVLTPRQMRNALVAALFHDFNHSGMLGDDDLNIERAIRGLRRHVAIEDQPYVEEIIELIRATQYPNVIPLEQLDLCGKILRDADLSQAFSVAWIQQVVFGLASEWGTKPIDVLRLQEPFHRNLIFQTDWAKQRFTQAAVDAKIQEARELLELLEPAPAVTVIA
jgi:hypothetical protein